MQFEGIYPPVITPCLDDGSIDYTGFETVINHLVDAQVHGIIVGGTTGEYYAQTRDERAELMRIARDVIGGRVPLIVGTGAIRTEDCIDYGRLARDNDADAILMSAPFYAVPTQQELAEHALAIDRAVGLPVMLYNYPGRTGAMMGPAFLERVAESPNFVAVKESSGDIDQLHRLALDYPQLTLLCGMDDQALEFFAWGARGWVCPGANCLPAEHLALYRAVALDNDIEQGRRIMTALMPFLRVLEQGGKLIQYVKHACALQGLPSGTVRPPLRPLLDHEKRELEDVLSALPRDLSGLAGAATMPGDA